MALTFLRGMQYFLISQIISSESFFYLYYVVSLSIVN